MRKFLSYLALIIASILVILMFITATSYLQLVVAILLYPVLAYFAIKVFSVKKKVQAPTLNQVPPTTMPQAVVVTATDTEPSDALDLDKRSFLKFVGATSIFFFITSIFGKFVGNSSFINNLPIVSNFPGTTPAPVNADTPSSSSDIVTSGYTISEIDNGIVSYYGFTNKDGGWLIMKEDADTNSFRYSKGTQNFPGSWAGRAKLQYDYYYNLF